MRKAFSLAVFVAAMSAQPRFGFHDANGASLELTENGQAVFDYNYGMI